MAVITLGSGTLAIGATASPTDQFECQVSAFTITSTANPIPIPATMCDGPTSTSAPSSFSVAIEYMQDWSATPSLSRTLWEADGTDLYFEFVPTDATTDKASGRFSAQAGDYGGAGQDVWVSSDQMPCPEKPVIEAQT